MLPVPGEAPDILPFGSGFQLNVAPAVDDVNRIFVVSSLQIAAGVGVAVASGVGNTLMVSVSTGPGQPPDMAFTTYNAVRVLNPGLVKLNAGIGFWVPDGKRPLIPPPLASVHEKVAPIVGEVRVTA